MTKKILRGAILALIALGFAMPFVYSPTTTFPFVFGKAVFFSILVEIMAGLYLILIVLDRSYRPKRSLLFLILLFYVGALSVSTILGIDPHRSFWGNYERMSGLITILHFFVYFLIARSVVRTRRAWHILLWLFLLSSLVMAGIATAEHFLPGGLFANRPGGRVWATLGNYIYLGVYMLFALAFTLYLITVTRSRALRFFLVLASLYDLYILFLSQSRASLLALVISAIVLVLALSWQAKGRRRATGLAVVAFLVLGAAGLYLARNTEPVSAVPALRRLFTTGFSVAGDRTRILAWEIALDAWKAKPVFGWGPENFYAAFNVFYRPESLRYSYYETWFDRAHNSLLDVLVMSGTVGALLYFALLFAAAAAIIRRIRSSTLTAGQGIIFGSLFLAYFLTNLFAFDALSGFLLFYFTLAFIDSGNQENQTASQGIPASVRLAMFSPFILLCFYLIFLQVKMWQANVLSLQSIAAVRSGRIGAANALHAKALAFKTPHDFEIRADFAREAGQVISRIPPGEEQQAMLMLETAIKDLKLNVEKGRDVFDSILMAQLLSIVGTADPRFLPEAERVIVEAIPLSPKRQQIHYTLARILLLENRPAEAVRVLEQVVADEPKVGESHWLLSVALRQAGRESEAWPEFVQAVANRYQWRSTDEIRWALELASVYATSADRDIIFKALIEQGAAGSAFADYAEAEALYGSTSTAARAMLKALELDPTLAPRAEALWKKIGRPDY